LPVARLALRAAAHTSRRPEGKTVTTVEIDTTVMTGTTDMLPAGLQTVVAVVVAGVMVVGNRLWRVTGDALNADVTIFPGGWSASTVKLRNVEEVEVGVVEPRIALEALHHETGTKIAEGETATVTISEPAPGHATGGEGTTGRMPGDVMTGEVVAAEAWEVAGDGPNPGQVTGSAVNAVLTTLLGVRNALSAGRLSLVVVAGTTADPLEVLQWTAGVVEVEVVDSNAELGIGTALSVRHTISLRGLNASSVMSREINAKLLNNSF